MGIAYNDGATVEGRIFDLVADAKNLSSLSLIAAEDYGDWPVRYHLCPERGNLFRHLDFTGLDVLELGAGMGGASRFVAETARFFQAVEGTEPRARVLRKRLRDLDNWDATVSNIQDYQTDRRFDVVCLIGVLEYSELYIDPPSGVSPFAHVLAKATSFLKPGGVVVVAIENRNGIKYWAGAPEDHTGQMFDGICGYSREKTPRTFSRTALLEFLTEAGLPNVEEFFPWPDYKTPQAVLSGHFIDAFPDLAGDIAADAVERDPPPGVHYFPTTLALEELVRSRLLADLANSFLFIGGSEKNSPIQQRLFRRMREDNEYAWHYSVRRQFPTKTVFKVDPDDTQTPVIQKRLLLGEPARTSGLLKWRQDETGHALVGPKVAHILRRIAYFENRAAFESYFLSYLRWAMDRWACDETHLQPLAFDGIPQNAVATSEGFRAFDLEWVLTEPMPKSWFVFRNVALTKEILTFFRKPEYASMEELYESLCRGLGVVPNLEEAIDLEARSQGEVLGNGGVEKTRRYFAGMMREAAPPAFFPRDVDAELLMRHELGGEADLVGQVKDLKAENQRLQSLLDRRSVKMAMALTARIKRIRPLYALARKGVAVVQHD